MSGKELLIFLCMVAFHKLFGYKRRRTSGHPHEGDRRQDRSPLNMKTAKQIQRRASEKLKEISKP